MVNTVRPGGFTGAFRSLLGVVVEEFAPLAEGQTVGLDNGWTAARWTEVLQAPSAAEGVDVIASYSDGAVAGLPAITRRRVGRGTAWYLSADLDASSLGALIDQLLEETPIEPVASVSTGVEAVRRSSADRSYLFLVNHRDEEGWAEASGIDLLTGTAHEGRVPLAPGAVVVLRE